MANHPSKQPLDYWGSGIMNLYTVVTAYKPSQVTLMAENEEEAKDYADKINTNIIPEGYQIYNHGPEDKYTEIREE